MSHGRPDDPDGWTRHHILPSSRYHGSEEEHHGLNKDADWNILRVRRKYHEAWHLLFSNMTVEEVHRFIDERWARSNLP